MQSIADLDRCVDSCGVLEIYLSKKRDVIGHTAIVLAFDGVQQFTLDYGTVGGLMSSSSGSSGCVRYETIEINIYDPRIVDRKGCLLNIRLGDQNNREKVKQLLRELLDIGKVPYHLVKNNCRDYVEKVKNHLKKSDFGLSQSACESFEQEMSGIVLQDRNVSYLIGVILIFGPLICSLVFEKR